MMQAPAEPLDALGIRQAPAESEATPFPSLARRAVKEQQFSSRDANWLTRLFTELTFTQVLSLRNWLIGASMIEFEQRAGHVVALPES